MAVDPLIELHDVNKYYGELHVLQDIDLAVGKGEVAVVIGPSGPGKSTPCRTIKRLETVQSGTILLDGQPLPEEGKALARLRVGVGMVLKEEADSRSRRLLDRVGLADRAPEFPAQLSGGRQQRVAIMRQPARDGMTTAVVTHERGFARSAAGRVVFMSDGRITEDRAPEEFFTDPHSERAKDFLSRIPEH
ncbi:MAG: amino acid ABC transporter ATP-binding protein [Streptomyces sp.]|nr:amino acid ABC transporter ATP-binding protein [Streptomyces sp.]